MAGIGRLVADKQFIKVHPGEGWNGLGVIRQMCDEALAGRFGDIEHQSVRLGLSIFCIQNGCGQWCQDELIYFQDKHGHKGRLWGLIGNSTFNSNRYPGLFWLDDKNTSFYITAGDEIIEVKQIAGLHTLCFSHTVYTWIMLPLLVSVRSSLIAM